MDDNDDISALDAEFDILETSMDGARAVTAAFSAEVERVKGALASVNVDMASFEKGLSKGLKTAFDGVVFKGLELSDAMRVLGESISRTVYNAALKPVTDGAANFITQAVGGLFGASPFAQGSAFVGGAPTPLSDGGGIVARAAVPFATGGAFVGGAVTPFADGGAFAGGKVTPFADGGAFVGGTTAPVADAGAFVGTKVTPFAKGGVVSQATAFPMRGGLGLMGEAGPEAIMPLTRGADGSLGVRAQGGGGSNNVTINISTPDVAGFRRSQGQIAAQVNRALARGQRNA